MVLHIRSKIRAQTHMHTCNFLSNVYWISFFVFKHSQLEIKRLRVSWLESFQGGCGYSDVCNRLLCIRGSLRL